MCFSIKNFPRKFIILLNCLSILLIDEYFTKARQSKDKRPPLDFHNVFSFRVNRVIFKTFLLSIPSKLTTLLNKLNFFQFKLKRAKVKVIDYSEKYKYFNRHVYYNAIQIYFSEPKFDEITVVVQTTPSSIEVSRS